MKILTILGARPQFIKAAVVSRAIRLHNEAGRSPRFQEDIIHTGQHYDDNMSQVFFDELGIPQPVINLNIGSGTHGEMTAKMLVAIEGQIVSRKPDRVLVYGDTNSTLAGGLAAAKLHVPTAHVEAGLRSFNRRMPEEINRILTDHISELLFCPTRTAVHNLKTEGITRGVHHVGDVMYDATLLFSQVAADRQTILADLKLTPQSYHLATVHRAANTDDPQRLAAILEAFNRLATPEVPVVFPVHPRTRGVVERLCAETFTSSKTANGALRLLEPVPFLSMIQLEKNARTILTDSGGVQKEAYFHGVPCVTLRDETEWTETVTAGWNRVVGADVEAIVAAVHCAKPGEPIEDYGRGDSAQWVVRLLSEVP